MVEALGLALAFIASVCGLTWFAFAKPAHWQQARGRQPLTTSTKRALHFLGYSALALSLALCLWVDHVSMASLVWVMTLTGSALLVTFTLTWWPRLLAWLVGWAR